MSAVEPRLEEVFVVLDRLHRPKDRAYGDAWRKRGEVLGIFVNIARKFDRLAVALEETDGRGTESIGDTVADLCVYAGKYVTWLAERYPEAFAAVVVARPATRCAAVVGPNALAEVFSVVAGGDGVSAAVPVDVAAATRDVFSTFSELEEALTAQADGAPPLPADRKLGTALRLTWASGWLLVRLVEQDRRLLDEVVRGVEAMEERS